MATPSQLRNYPQEPGTARQLPEASGIGELLAQNPMMMQAQQPEMEMPKLQENKSLWKSFLDKAQTDPNIRMALMTMGAGMMRSPGFGQNAGDVIGSSIAQSLEKYTQGRQMDTQNAMAKEEQARKQKETDVGASVSQQNANTQSQSVGQQGRAVDASITQGVAQTAIAQAKSALEADLEPRKVKAQETAASADMVRSNAYSKAVDQGKMGGSSGQNVQLVNQRKTALMSLNPGMTEEEATITAQNDILMSKQSGGNPASIAKGLFDTQVKIWQNNLDNIGKTPSQQDIAGWTDMAKKTAIDWAKLNRATPTTPTSGVIDRGGTAPVAGQVPGAGSTEVPSENLVGKKVQGTNGIGEILGSDGANVRLRLPDGREITTTMEAISPYIIAE